MAAKSGGNLGGISQTVPGGLTGFTTWDLSDHSNLGPLNLGINGLFLVLVPIFIGLRIYVRFFLVRKIGWDDALCITAAIIAMAFYSMNIYGVSQGLGRHIWDLVDFTNIMGIIPRVKTLVLILWINNHLYSTALMLVKCSIVACYLRVFPGRVIFHRIIWAATGIIIGLWIASVVVGIVQCNPPQAAWEITYEGARCFPIVNFFYPATGINIATDLVLCIAPLPILWRLRVSRLERTVVIVLFCFGFFATAASIARLVTLTQYVLGGEDFTRFTTPTLIWSGVEIGVGIICATVPALRPLLQRLIPRGSFDFSFSWKLTYISTNTRTTAATSQTAQSSQGFDMLTPKAVESEKQAGLGPTGPTPEAAITISQFSPELDTSGQHDDVGPSEPDEQHIMSGEVRPIPPPTSHAIAKAPVPSFSRPLNTRDVQWYPPAQWDVEKAPESSGPLLYPLNPRLREPQTRMGSRTSFYGAASESLGLNDKGPEKKSKRNSQQSATDAETAEQKDPGMLTRIYEGSSSSDDTFIIDKGPPK